MPASLALDSRGNGGQPGKGGWWRTGRAMVSGGMIQTAKCEVDGEGREGRKRTTWFSNLQMNIGGIYLSVTWPHR
jgi:hypothetical protein